jgi:putative ABC transport system substrate-binding protein
MPVIGFLSPVSQNEGASARIPAEPQGGRLVEGENVSISYPSAENQMDRLPALADDLARRRVAVIMAIGQFSTLKAATTTIPIVFVAGEDPARLGLVASLARPGGNLTRINIFAAELVAKRLQLLREMASRSRGGACRSG